MQEHYKYLTFAILLFILSIYTIIFQGSKFRMYELDDPKWKNGNGPEFVPHSESIETFVPGWETFSEEIESALYKWNDVPDADFSFQSPFPSGEATYRSWPHRHGPPNKNGIYWEFYDPSVEDGNQSSIAKTRNPQ